MKLQSTLLPLAAALLTTLATPVFAQDTRPWIEVSTTAKITGPITTGYKLEKINQLVERLKKRIPARFHRKVFSRPVDIIFQQVLNRDALFYPPEGDRPARILVNANLYFNPNLETLLSHEIFHAVHYALNPNEESWVREGLAQYFEYMMDGKTNGVSVTHAFTHIETALTAEYDVNKSDRALYGHGLLYFYYLIQKCGGEPLFWELVDYGPKGKKQIDEVLSKRANIASSCQDFETSYKHFEVARVVNRSLYHYNEPHIYSLMPTSQRVEPRKRPLDKCELKPFTPYYLTADAYKASKLTLVRDLLVYQVETQYPYGVEESTGQQRPGRNVLLIPAASFTAADFCQQ